MRRAMNNIPRDRRGARFYITSPLCTRNSIGLLRSAQSTAGNSGKRSSRLPATASRDWRSAPTTSRP